MKPCNFPGAVNTYWPSAGGLPVRALAASRAVPHRSLKVISEIPAPRAVSCSWNCATFGSSDPIGVAFSVGEPGAAAIQASSSAAGLTTAGTVAGVVVVGGVAVGAAPCGAAVAAVLGTTAFADASAPVVVAATGPLPPLRPVMMIPAIPATTDISAAVSRNRRMLKTDCFRESGELLFIVFSSVTRSARWLGCDAGHTAGPQRPSSSRSPSQSWSSGIAWILATVMSMSYGSR